ncbi:hypothetical protein SAMN02927921_00747 [Sinomicrobium oceani]|uniref:Uncharacterized protein n=1 Tax=Sinomicrobium oceani TaxID=1150368 RepID=A0A1K1MQU0_9FLAO|nr:hypothetical protein SAMN02927921_00747 [Sinomicrobium oceani]
MNMVRKIIYIMTSSILILFLLIVILDIIEALNTPEKYHFGSEAMPVYYRTQELYIMSVSIMCLWIVVGLWFGINSLRKRIQDKYFIVYTAVFLLFILFNH